jgi:hypothetical protein
MTCWLHPCRGGRLLPHVDCLLLLRLVPSWARSGRMVFQVPLLGFRKDSPRREAIKLWRTKRLQGCQACSRRGALALQPA